MLGEQKKDKEALVNMIQELYTFAETRLLSIQEWEERIDIEDRLENINRAEELHWKQKARNKWLLEGDSYFYFFHQFANGSRRKTPFLF